MLNQHFYVFLKTFGLHPITADPCLYLRRNEKEFILVIIWVDDGLVCSDNGDIIKEIVHYLSKHFDMRCAPAHHFVGLSIHRNRQERTLYVSQPDYIKRTLLRFQMGNCNPKGLPADPGCRLEKSQDSVESCPEKMPYREAIGSLMYLMLASRPDIAFAVNQVSQFCEKPNQNHWTAVRRIFAYLQGTSEYGIRFGPVSNGLIGYTDADYAGDLETRRSTTGYLFLLHGGPVAWISRRQSCVSLSTTESEFVAACETTREGIWLQRLLKDLSQGPADPITIMCDNQSAIQLIKNPVFHQRTKHIDVRFHFIREHLEAGNIKVLYVPTNDQIADPFTKPLPNPRFSVIRTQMGIVAVPTNLI